MKEIKKEYVESSTKDDIEKFIEKYDKDMIFFSFRAERNVSLINPNNMYSTPTGIYTYPYNFMKKILSSNHLDYLSSYKDNNNNNIFLFTGRKKPKYLYIYKVKKSAILIDNKTNYDDLLPYAYKLLDIFGNDSFLINSYLKSEKDYISNATNSEERKFTYSKLLGKGFDRFTKVNLHKLSSAALFWNLIQDLIEDLISKSELRGKRQTKFNNICRKIGIDGFVDNKECNFIHPVDRINSQAVFFRSRSIIEDYTSISINKDKNIKILSNKILNFDLNDLNNLINEIYELSESESIIIKLSKHLNRINKIEDLTNKLIGSKYDILNKFVNDLKNFSNKY